MKNTPKEGDTVTWDWSNSTAEGTVTEVKKQCTEITSEGSTVVRAGNEDDPAVVIRQADETKVLKLVSELNS